MSAKIIGAIRSAIQHLTFVAHRGFVAQLRLRASCP